MAIKKNNLETKLSVIPIEFVRTSAQYHNALLCKINVNSTKRFFHLISHRVTSMNNSEKCDSTVNLQIFNPIYFCCFDSLEYYQTLKLYNYMFSVNSNNTIINFFYSICTKSNKHTRATNCIMCTRTMVVTTHTMFSF